MKILNCPDLSQTATGTLTHKTLRPRLDDHNCPLPLPLYHPYRNNLLQMSDLPRQYKHPSQHPSSLPQFITPYHSLLLCPIYPHLPQLPKLNLKQSSQKTWNMLLKLSPTVSGNSKSKALLSRKNMSKSSIFSYSAKKRQQNHGQSAIVTSLWQGTLLQAMLHGPASNGPMPPMPLPRCSFPQTSFYGQLVRFNCFDRPRILLTTSLPSKPTSPSLDLTVSMSRGSTF